MPKPGQIVPFLAVWTKDKLWKTLDTAPTIIISECAGSARLVDGANMTEHPAVPGLYRYLLTLPAGEEKNYIGKCTCSDTDTDYQDTPSFWGDVQSISEAPGDWLITIQLYDDGTTDPIDAGLVTIVDASNYPLEWAGVTGNAGQTEIKLDDGSYTLRIRKDDYIFADVPLTVSGSDQTVTAYGVPIPGAGESQTLKEISGDIGPWLTTIQLYIDGGVTPIDAGLLELLDSTGKPLAWQGVTGPTGQTEVSLSDGSYTLKARKDWFTFANVPITVAGAAQTVTAYGVVVPFPSGGEDVVGNRKVSMQVYEDGTATPINDALISIVTNLGQPVAWSGVSDVAGQATAYLGDGSYEIRTRKAGFTFAAVPITLAGADVPATIYGIEYSIDAPVDPELCAIEEFLALENPDKIPETTSATLQITANPPGSPTLLTTKRVYPDYNATTGVIRWEIPRGTTIRVNIPEHDIRNYNCIVPDVAGIRLTEVTPI